MTERLTQPEAAQDHRVARKAPNSRPSAGGSRRLNREGVRDTTLRDLAAEMNLTRAALYYYIEDREDLVFQVYRRSCDLLARALGEAVAEGGSALETVSRFVARAFTVLGFVENMSFYPSAAAAQQAGFRACKRCRPDASPGSPRWNARAGTQHGKQD